jgi:DNA-binding response OmpR family regulator
MSNILLVEDDSVLAFSIEFTLKSEGFDVKVANNLKYAGTLLDKLQFDLILLDIKLPDGNGYDFCKQIRLKSDIPIIFLTACDEEVNIVTGLDIGADDYITKPFKIRELISRINAVLRRNNKKINKTDLLISGEIQVYTLQGMIKKNGEEIIATALEYRLLLHLMKHPKQVLSRNSILEGLWDFGGEFIDDNSLSVYIRRLREKIENNPAEPKYIITLRGLGYKWDCDVH